jgi:DNA end-binding protein Ku
VFYRIYSINGIIIESIISMRSIWKGHIRFSLVTIPIQIFNAVETGNNIRFNQLHKKDNGRVKYKKVCRTCDDTLKTADIVKGYEYEPDQYVVFEQSEFNALKLKSTRAIDVEAFVDQDEVHPSRYEAVYYVGPNGEVATKTFNLFYKVLEKSKKAGVGRIILRDREDVVLLTAKDGAIVMYKLRYPYEIRDIKDVPDIKEEEVDEKQLKLAESLVESLETSFDKVDFEDRFRDALLDLVNKKVEGKEIVTISEGETETKPVVDIMDALKASIEAAKQKAS